MSRKPDPERRRKEPEGQKAGSSPKVKPDERIRDRDQRVGRQIKQQEPSCDEPGYANDDNMPNE